MSDRVQLLQVGNSKSEESAVLFGVPQGGCLSPLLFVLFTSDMPDACSLAWLIMYADDTNCFTVGKNAEEAKEKLERAAEQIVCYMEENKMSPNAAKTEYMLFGRRQGGAISVRGEEVKESHSMALLGLTINKAINWDHHLLKMERELSSRIWAIRRLRGYLPQHALLKIIPGFFNSKATYMLDVITDPTGGETGTARELGGILHRLQVKQNKALRAILGIKAEDKIGEEQLLRRTGIAGIRELSRRLNYMLAWRVFSPFGDLQDLADGKLKHHEHTHTTRASTRGDIVQQTNFPSFVKKCAVMYNEVSHLTKHAKSKAAAKALIKKWCKPVWAVKKQRKADARRGPQITKKPL